MVENLIREMEKSDGAGIMGIYGGAHTDITAMEYVTGEVPCMAAQLQKKYGDALHTRDLTFGLRTDGPYTGEPLQEERTESITVGEKTYTARYLGKVELGQVFVIDYTRTDGSVERVFHRYEIRHFVRDGRYATIGFNPEG